MLKGQFHSHTNYLHPNEGNYSPKELIDRAYVLGYDVLCITEHYIPHGNNTPYKQDPLKTYRDFKEYAKKKGILLIPGVELFTDEGEVILINFEGDITQFKRMKDLAKLPKNVAAIASHPYYRRSSCLGDRIYKYQKLLDGVEFSHFYLKIFNPNKKALTFAKKLNKTVLGTGDVHRLYQLETTYSLVDAKKTAEDVVNAIKKRKVQLVTKPLSLYGFLYLTSWVIFATLWIKLKEAFEMK